MSEAYATETEKATALADVIQAHLDVPIHQLDARLLCQSVKPYWRQYKKARNNFRLYHRRCGECANCRARRVLRARKRDLAVLECWDNRVELVIATGAKELDAVRSRCNYRKAHFWTAPLNEEHTVVFVEPGRGVSSTVELADDALDSFVDYLWLDGGVEPTQSKKLSTSYRLVKKFALAIDCEFEDVLPSECIENPIRLDGRKEPAEPKEPIQPDGRFGIIAGFGPEDAAVLDALPPDTRSAVLDGELEDAEPLPERWKVAFNRRGGRVIKFVRDDRLETIFRVPPESLPAFETDLEFPIPRGSSKLAIDVVDPRVFDIEPDADREVHP